MLKLHYKEIYLYTGPAYALSLITISAPDVLRFGLSGWPQPGAIYLCQGSNGAAMKMQYLLNDDYNPREKLWPIGATNANRLGRGAEK